MTRKLVKAMLSCVLTVFILLPFALTAFAKDADSELLYDGELKLTTFKKNNFLEFGSIISSNGMKQSVLIENKSEKETVFYLQLLHVSSHSVSNVHDKEMIKNIINDNVRLKITDENKKIIYNETTEELLQDIYDQESIKVIKLKQNESMVIDFQLCSLKESDEKYADFASHLTWRFIAKQSNKPVCLIDNNSKKTDISREMCAIEGTKNTGKINDAMVYICVAFIVIGIFYSIYVFKTEKYNSLPDEDG